MHRTEGANNVDGLFIDGPPATAVGSDWLNAVQEEIATVIEANGDTLDSAGADSHDQLLTAIQEQKWKAVLRYDLDSYVLVGGGSYTILAYSIATIQKNIVGLISQNEATGVWTIVKDCILKIDLSLFCLDTNPATVAINDSITLNLYVNETDNYVVARLDWRAAGTGLQMYTSLHASFLHEFNVGDTFVIRTESSVGTVLNIVPSDSSFGQTYICIEEIMAT